jgi:Transposase, Mutator family
VKQTVSLEDGQPTLVMCGLLSARQRSSPQGSGDQDPRKQHKLLKYIPRFAETARSATRPRSWADGRAPIHTAVNADAALAELERFDQAWGTQYPMIAASWRTHWDHITPFLSLPADLSKARDRRVRRLVRTR